MHTDAYRNFRGCPASTVSALQRIKPVSDSKVSVEQRVRAREMTEVQLAMVLGKNQAAVSKLERRDDMYVSTLQDFVNAIGGKLI